VHHQQPADALGLAGADVEDPAARLELARVDAEVGELADVGVGHDLERERREGLFIGGVANRRALARLGALVGLEALDRLHVERARQVVEDRVEQRLHALVLEARAAEDRRDRVGERGLADRGLDHRDRDLVILEDHLHELVVVVGDLLEQMLAGDGGSVDQVGGISATSWSLPRSSL